MAILQFIKPDKVILLNSDDFRGQFEFRPLEPGFGLTIGNALRRVLLSSLEGYAISSIKIEGVEHEFSTIPGVIEDVTEIILNLKQLRLKATSENQTGEQVVAKVSGKTQQTFFRKDFQFVLDFGVIIPFDLAAVDSEFFTGGLTGQAIEIFHNIHTDLKRIQSVHLLLL